MTKEVNAHVNFKENCEYQASTIDRIISIEPQPVNIDVSITNLNVNHHYTENYDNNPINDVYFFDDTLEIKAHVFQQSGQTQKDIQVGRIEFYYQPVTSNIPTKLNDKVNSCILSKQGLATIHFKPNQPGQIIAKYVDDKQWYAEAEKSISFSLQPIPVSIKFTKKPPYIVDLEDSVELEVEVSKKYPNPDDGPLNYGVVTFLHYIEHFDMNSSEKRVERVIGNPALVKDGKATIKYIPVQEYSDLEPTQLLDKTEYIRAVYNYDNDLYYSAQNNTYSYESINYDEEIYTNKWEYFGSANVYTNIEIYKPNSVTIGISNKNISDDGRYEYTENESIIVTAVLKDEKGKEIVLPKNSTKDLTLHIIGTYFTLSDNYLINSDNKIDDYFIFHKYEKDVSFDEYIKEADNHGYFKTTISNLKPGNYTIQASTRGQIIDGQVLLYPSTINGVVETEYNDETHIQYDTDSVRTDEYLDSIDISNTLYINSILSPTQHSLATRCTKGIIQTGEVIDNFITCDVTIDNSYKEILNGQRCCFYSPKNDTTYIGSLSYNQNTLKGVLPQNTKIMSMGEYPLYAYIPAGYYTKNDKIIYLDYSPSVPITMHVRDILTIDLEYTFLSEKVLGAIDYTVSSDNIYLDDYINVDIKLKKGNTIIDTQSCVLSHDMNASHNTFDNLAGGNYTITATIVQNDYTASKNFTILADAIEQQLQPNSKVINATPNGTIDLVISSSSADLTNLDLNKLFVYINKNTATLNKNTATVNCNYVHSTYKKYIVKKVTKESIHLTVNAGTYLPTQLLVTAYYSGDSNIEETTCISETCETVLIEPTITVDYETNNSMFLWLNDEKFDDIVVIGKIMFMQNNRPIGNTKLFISNYNTDIYIQNIPQECNHMQIDINPYDSGLMEVINGSDIEQQLSASFGTINTLCDHGSGTYSLCNLEKVVEQYNESNHQCLFPIFKHKVIDISRKII